MRKLLMLYIVAALAYVLPAQTPLRSNAQPATSSKNAKPAATAKTRAGSAPATAEPAAPQTGATPRTTTTSPGRQETTANTRNANAAPANGTAIQAKTTAKQPTPKTVPAQMPAAPTLKQEKPQIQVQWMTLEEALEKSKTEKRKIFIDVFTDWCGWCKRMDESTFVNPEVAQYLNDNYYAVKFNAEQQEDIIFNNKTYHFKKNGTRGYHELAAEWLNNRLSFPTVVFLDESMNLIQPIPGYLEAPKLETILNYFGTDSHRTTPWETYEKKFGANQR